MTTLRLLTFNVASLRRDSDAVCRVVQRARPDVVCVQEAPRFLRWRTRCAALARDCGLVVVTGGRSAAGNLLLSQMGVQVDHCADILLERVPRLHQRGAAMAVCRLRGARFAVVGTHLDLDAAARLRHVGELLDALPGHGVPAGVPLVVAGDVNEETPGPAVARLAGRFTDVAVAAGEPAPTFPVANPHRRIDVIFADPALGVRSCQVLDSEDVRAASDHRPVLAELDLPEP